jgi:hypothetical protein
MRPPRGLVVRNRNIMQQRGQAYDSHIGALGLRQPFTHMGDAQHMVKVMRAIAARVELAGFLFG